MIDRSIAFRLFPQSPTLSNRLIFLQLNEASQKRAEPAVRLADDSQPDDQPADDCANIHKSVLRPQQQNCSTPKTNKCNSSSNKDDSAARQPVAGDQQHDASNSENQPLKGILKFSSSWKKRTLSESSFDNSSSFTDHDDDDETNFSLSLSCTDLDVYAERSASKRVTFNKQISSKVFRAEPTAAGKKRADEKKGKNGKKKNKKAKSSECSEKSDRKASAGEKSPKKPLPDQENAQPAADKNEASIDELSFLLCSSESDGSLEKEKETGAGDEEDDDDLLDLQSKIEHQPFDDESWSEMKSSKKKNRKSRSPQTGSGDEKRENEHEAGEVNEVSGSAPSSCEQESQPMSLGMKQSLAIEVN